MGGLYGLLGLSFGTYGVKGVSASDGPDLGTVAGVWGTSSGGIGILGTSTSTVGVQGTSINNAGVYGVGPIGVYATGTGVAGVFGGSTGNGFGFWGNSVTSAGIYGTSTSGPGVRAESTNQYGLYAKGPTWAGVFEGHVFVTGTIVAQGGVFGASGTTSARAAVEDFGDGTLVNGRATVALDRAFVDAAQTDRYHVVVTPHDASVRGLAVVARRRDSFDVQELAGGPAEGPATPRRGAMPPSATAWWPEVPVELARPRRPHRRRTAPTSSRSAHCEVPTGQTTATTP